jgi:hypothetical protein
VAFLAAFPPFEVSHKWGPSLAMIMGSETKHLFVMEGGANPVNLPSMPGSLTEAGTFGGIVTRDLNLPTLFSEFLFLTAVAGFLFVQVKDEKP